MCSTMFCSGDDMISLGVAIVFVFVSGSEGQIIKPAGIFKSVYHKKEPVLADRLRLFAFGIGEWFGKAQEIVGGYLEVGTNRLDILQAGFVLASFQIRDLPLCHTQQLTQLRLIQFVFFPEEFQLFAKGQFHSHHRD